MLRIKIKGNPYMENNYLIYFEIIWVNVSSQFYSLLISEIEISFRMESNDIYSVWYDREKMILKNKGVFLKIALL